MADLRRRGGTAEPYPVQWFTYHIVVDRLCEARDRLRVGTDVEGLGRTFNASFSLNGQIIPEPASVVLGATGLLLALGWGRWTKVRPGS